MFAYQDTEIFFQHSLDADVSKLRAQSFALHMHTVYEVYYFIAGRVRYLVEGRVYKLQPGDIMLMRPGEFHRVLIDGDEPYERMALHFDPKLVEAVENGALLLHPFTEHPLGAGNHYSAGELRVGHIYECLQSIDTAPGDPQQRRLAIQSNLFPILYEIQSAFIRRDSCDPLQRHTELAGSRIVDYINANLTGNLSLEMLSKKFFMSKNHVSRLFKGATGSSLWEYVLTKRLLLAREKIHDGMAANIACTQCGFGDYSAFYRAYKKHFGDSPTQR